MDKAEEIAINMSNAAVDGIDLNVHELLNFGSASGFAADVVRTVSYTWATDDDERNDPNGPRIGTLYATVDPDGMLTLKIVTRIKV